MLVAVEFQPENGGGVKADADGKVCKVDDETNEYNGNSAEYGREDTEDATTAEDGFNDAANGKGVDGTACCPMMINLTLRKYVVFWLHEATATVTSSVTSGDFPGTMPKSVALSAS